MSHPGFACTFAGRHVIAPGLPTDHIGNMHTPRPRNFNLNKLS